MKFNKKKVELGFEKNKARVAAGRQFVCKPKYSHSRPLSLKPIAKSLEKPNHNKDSRAPKTSRNVEIDNKLKYTQNFIKSSSLIAQIIEQKTTLTRTDKVIEIGTGSGKITRALAPRVLKVVTVEKDLSLINKIKTKLSEFSNINFVYKDFLTFDLRKMGAYKVFSNIPFAITADIIRKLLFSSNNPTEAYLILQLEAYLRFIGNDSDHSVQMPAKILPFYDVGIIHRFDKEDFSPPPRVRCIMAKFIEYDNYLIKRSERTEYWDFVDFVMFMKKDNIKSTFKELLTIDQLKHLGRRFDFDPYGNIQQIKPAIWVELFRFVKDRGVITQKFLNIKKFKELKRVVK